MLNLWSHLAGDERVSEQEGGAVEFRRQYHQPLYESTFRCGVWFVDAKARSRFGHLLFN